MNDAERKVFWDTLCSLEGKDINAEYNELQKTIKYPKYIYRYRPVDLHSLEALQENKLYYTSASNYDDPFDTFIHVDWDRVKEIINKLNLKKIVDKRIIPYLPEDIVKNPKNYDLIIKIFKEKLLESTFDLLNDKIKHKIQKESCSICFSENGINENLWLKYAEQHRGFCLVYNVRNEDNFICGKKDKCEKCNMKRIQSLYPVYYSNNKYDATKLAINYTIEIIIREKIKDEELRKKFIRDNPMYWERERTSLTKRDCHRYDQEWRISLGKKPESDSIYLKWIPEAVILGLRIERLNAKMVVRSAKRAGIDNIWQIMLDSKDDLRIAVVPENIINGLLNDDNC